MQVSLSHILVEQRYNDRMNLITPEGKPTPALQALLNFFNIQANDRRELIRETQKLWLRDIGKERWESSNPYGNLKQLLIPYFKKLDLIDEIKPQHSKYDYALLMGSLFQEVKHNTEYLAALWQQGIRWDQTILLGCERTLDAQEEPASLFENQLPHTESEMMQYVFKYTNLATELRALKTTYINALNTFDSYGNPKRATTADTLKTWLKNNPKSGSCLVISNQPHIHYQESVAKNILPKSFIIEAVGPTINETIQTNEILDALARLLYQEDKNAQQIF